MPGTVVALSADTMGRGDDALGAKLLACVTCLEHFGLTDRIVIGQVSNMREIVQRMAAAAKVITV